MFNKLKKKSITKSLGVVVLCLLIGILLIVFEISNVISLLKGHMKFETLEPDEINEHIIVDASINANFGSFIEEYERNTKTGVTRTTSLYYVIWTGDEDAEDYRYMGIKVPVADERAMEDMAEATYNYEYSDSIEYSGAVNRMSDEEYEYFVDYFLESGWTQEEIEEYTLPYFINVGALIGSAAATTYIIFAVGVLLALIGIVRLIIAFAGGGLKTIKKELEDMGMSENEAEYEYEAARVLDTVSDVRIGRKLTFFVAGSKPHAVLNEKLVWAYQRTTTHRKYGIKIGTTYEVVFSTYEKKTFNVVVRSENEAQAVIEHINEGMPWVMLGYSQELQKMYNKDFQKFLELRYNNGSQKNDLV